MKDSDQFSSEGIYSRLLRKYFSKKLSLEESCDLAEISHRNGETKFGRKIILDYLRIKPTDPWLYYRLAVFDVRLGDYEKAMDILDDVWELGYTTGCVSELKNQVALLLEGRTQLPQQDVVKREDVELLADSEFG